MDRTERFGSANRVIQIGFWTNAGLMIMKLLAGYFGRSEAVFADGMESAADFIAILSSMIALKIGSRPFDEQHPYGHGKAESIAAIIVSLVIFATGGWILVRSVHSIIDGAYEVPGVVAVAAAFLTIITKEALYRYTVGVGGRLGSPAILASAKDHRKDAITSVSTLVGVTGAYFGLAVMDPLAAGLTSFFIFHIGYETFMTAAHDLMDGRLEDACVDDMVTLAESVPGVEHVHEIKCRRSGQYLIVDLKLDMDAEMTVKRSHAIATDVKKLFFERFHNVGDVMIHINPHEEEHEDLNRL
ncbi:MAG: cation diffusion facilitator family transporter [Nitrospiraceae bacterium]|nr:cation diffusion facilitator family transporter [Nitrospiraceae bacterium]